MDREREWKMWIGRGVRVREAGKREERPVLLLLCGMVTDND